jgi:TatD-related deoxyribonuclease
MPVPPDLPVVDHHCHLSPNGEGVAAAQRFRAAGGTHLFLATQSYEAAPPTSVDGYARQFETTLQLAAKVRAEARVVVHVLLAPFPVDLVQQAEAIGLPAAMEVHRGALDLSGRLVREHQAIGLGEVGWPHFEVPPTVATGAFDVFRHALRTARDVGCPAVVHSPDLDASGYRALAEVSIQEGLAPSRVVKHYARTAVPTSDRHGIAASYVATRELTQAALAQEGPWFLETDFLDDPRRPGAVLDLATVPRRARAIADRNAGSVERLRIPFLVSIQSAYGFTPSVEEVPVP